MVGPSEHVVLMFRCTLFETWITLVLDVLFFQIEHLLD